MFVHITAVERAEHASSHAFQREALRRWSLTAVAPMYERWLIQLDTLWRDGWYERAPDSLIQQGG